MTVGKGIEDSAEWLEYIAHLLDQSERVEVDPKEPRIQLAIEMFRRDEFKVVQISDDLAKAMSEKFREIAEDIKSRE